MAVVSTLKGKARFREGGLVLVIVLFSVVLAVFGGSATVKERVGVDDQGQPVFEQRVKNRFLNADTLLTLMKEASFIAIMAIGATMVIVLGGIDLSVGAIYALAAVLGAMFLHRWGGYPTFGGVHGGLPFWISGTVGVAICIAAGMVCGFCNGAMVTLLRIHPFIITLGTLAIFRGIAFVLTKGQSVTPFPPELQAIVRWDVGSGLYPTPLIVLIAVTLVSIVFLRYTVLGREIYAVGDNPEAARYSGIRTNRITLIVFTIAGGLAGLTAVIFLGYYGAADSNTGQGYELDVIAAAVVGGASLTGGRGGALGAVLGAILIKMIDQGIVILEIDQNYSRIIIGTVIIVAVALDQLNQWYTRRRLTRAAQIT